MTDRELLELAAKAAGMPKHVDGMGFETAHHPKWNPLTDDGDALRLAVKVGVSFWQGSDVAVADHDALGPKMREDYNGDPYAATRRAITRAAADIGKATP